jgi:hypothetical protein
MRETRAHKMGGSLDMAIDFLSLPGERGKGEDKDLKG